MISLENNLSYRKINKKQGFLRLRNLVFCVMRVMEQPLLRIIFSEHLFVRDSLCSVVEKYRSAVDKTVLSDKVRTCIKNTKRLRHLFSQIPEPYLCGLFNRNFAGRSKFLLIHLRQNNRQNAGFVFCLDILGLYIADIEATRTNACVTFLT